MEKHFHLSDLAFEQQFADCSLDPTLFSHEAHLRLAWIHIKKYGIDQAIENICQQIKHYAASLGAHDKYNETVTIAAIRAVYHFMLRSKTDHFQDFIIENPRLKTSFKELLFSHYSTDIFTSERAKKEYLEPELLPFD
ncbi:MAG: hypothetical protein SFU99_21205 [Saprospiraceae bacterium]|nr:hypothetical protein [Saprospiraceae bacterium]